MGGSQVESYASSFARSLDLLPRLECGPDVILITPLPLILFFLTNINAEKSEPNMVGLFV